MYRVGGIKYKRFVNLIGYCCEGNERFFVVEFMLNDIFVKYLFCCMFFYFYILYIGGLFNIIVI